MLQFKVKQLLESRGILTPFSWLVKHCEFSASTANKLLHGKQSSLSLKHVGIICEHLQCTPNDLLYWDNTNTNKLLETHPLITNLAMPPKRSDIKTLLKAMQPDDIKNLYNTLLENDNKKK